MRPSSSVTARASPSSGAPTDRAIRAPDHGRECRWIGHRPGDPGAPRRPPVVDPLAGRPRPARDDECRRRVETHRARRRRIPRAHAHRHLAAWQLGRARARELPSARRPRDPRRRPACRLSHARHLRRRRRDRQDAPDDRRTLAGIPTCSARPGRRPATPSATAGSRSSAKGCARCSTSLQRTAPAIGRWTLGLALRTTRQ